MIVKVALPYRDYDVQTAPVGSELENQYQLEIDARGNKSLVKTGEINVQQLIDSYADECDVNRIVQRFRSQIEAGDLSPIQKREPQYYDAVGSSLNLADYHNSFNVIRGVFENDKEVFEKYNGDFAAFVADHIKPGKGDPGAQTTEVREVPKDES